MFRDKNAIKKLQHEKYTLENKMKNLNKVKWKIVFYFLRQWVKLLSEANEWVAGWWKSPMFWLRSDQVERSVWKVNWWWAFLLWYGSSSWNG
jgi:hypothetical protein